MEVEVNAEEFASKGENDLISVKIKGRDEPVLIEKRFISVDILSKDDDKSTQLNDEEEGLEEGLEELVIKNEDPSSLEDIEAKQPEKRLQWIIKIEGKLEKAISNLTDVKEEFEEAAKSTDIIEAVINSVKGLLDSVKTKD
jgi:hypothetical protein